VLSPFKLLLDRIAERCLALAAGLVASALETMHLKHQTEQQSELESLARRYDADGQPDLAEALRERVRRLDWENPMAQGERLLEQLRERTPAAEVSAEVHDDDAAQRDTTRRLTTKPRRPRPTEPTPDSSATPVSNNFHFPAIVSTPTTDQSAP